jgi:hypothetical protein
MQVFKAVLDGTPVACKVVLLRDDAAVGRWRNEVAMALDLGSICVRVVDHGVVLLPAAREPNHVGIPALEAQGVTGFGWLLQELGDGAPSADCSARLTPAAAPSAHNTASRLPRRCFALPCSARSVDALS